MLFPFVNWRKNNGGVPMYLKYSIIDMTEHTSNSVSHIGGGRVVRRWWVNFECRGVLLIWVIVGQGPIALAVGAGGGYLVLFFSRLSVLFSFSLSFGDGPI